MPSSCTCKPKPYLLAATPRSITGADAMHSTALLVGSGFNKLWQMTVVFGGIELVLSQVRAVPVPVRVRGITHSSGMGIGKLCCGCGGMLV